MAKSSSNQMAKDLISVLTLAEPSFLVPPSSTAAVAMGSSDFSSLLPSPEPSLKRACKRGQPLIVTLEKLVKDTTVQSKV